MGEFAYKLLENQPRLLINQALIDNTCIFLAPSLSPAIVHQHHNSPSSFLLILLCPFSLSSLSSALRFYVSVLLFIFIVLPLSRFIFYSFQKQFQYAIQEKSRVIPVNLTKSIHTHTYSSSNFTTTLFTIHADKKEFIKDASQKP